MNSPQETKFFGADGFDFGDLVDVINPLQHLPVISSIYRTLTGDEISPASRLAGGAFFGGPIGLVSAFATGVIEDATETTIGDVIVSAFTDEDETGSAKQLATSRNKYRAYFRRWRDGSANATSSDGDGYVNPAPSEPRTPLQPHAIMAAFEKPKPSPLAFAGSS